MRAPSRPRHRASTGRLRTLTGHGPTGRPRRTRRRLGPPLLLALVLAVTSATLTGPSDASVVVPAPTTGTVGG